MHYNINDLIFAYNCYDRKPFYYIITDIVEPKKHMRVFVMWGGEVYRDCKAIICHGGLVIIGVEQGLELMSEQNLEENIAMKSEEERKQKSYEFLKQGAGVYR